MIDIHTHILPNLDDGADSIEEAVAMAELAADSGTRGMVASSHGNLGEYSLRDYFSAFQQLRTAIKEEGISLELYSGMEVYMDENAVSRLKKQELLTLNNTRYVLIEFPFQEELWMANEYLQALQENGYIPVVAHLERYACIQRHPQAAFEWAENGCVLQANKGSFLGSFGNQVRDTAISLLAHNLVHVIASDAHSSGQRNPSMGNIARFLEKTVSERYRDVLLWENPLRILNGREILSPPPVPYRRRRF